MASRRFRGPDLGGRPPGYQGDIPGRGGDGFGGGFQKPGGDGDIYSSGMGSNKSPDQGSNLTINTQPKGQKGSSNKYLAAGAGGYYFWLTKKKNDENEK